MSGALEVSDAQAVLENIGRTPATIADLAWRLGISRRRVEAALQELRLGGEPIITDDRGVRITSDPHELYTCVAALRRRTVTQYLTIRAMRRTAQRLELQATHLEQPSLWESAS